MTYPGLLRGPTVQVGKIHLQRMASPPWPPYNNEWSEWICITGPFDKEENCVPDIYVEPGQLDALIAALEQMKVSPRGLMEGHRASNPE